MASWERALLRRLHVPVTPQNIRFLQGWQRWEGGHTNNDARFNWLNTTKNAPGAVGSINDVGVKKFKDFRSGINALALTLQNGRYSDLLGGFKTGDPFKYDVTSGLSTWVSGSPTGNLEYAHKVMGQSGTPKAALPRGGRGLAGNTNLVPDFNIEPLKIAFDDDPEFLAMLSQISDKQAQRTRLVSPGGSVRPIAATSDVVRAAQSQLGKPYVFGSGASTESFDCSDLIQWAYAQVGIDIPRTTFDQINAGHSVSWKDLRPGDLIFPTNHHVVMYVGNGKVIAAPHTGTVVQYQDVNKFKNPVAIRRVS